MFTFQIQPRLSETDGLKHISNTVLPVWFEEARRDLFMLFNPTMDLENWDLIIKKFEIEIFNRIKHTEKVTIETVIEYIGSSSLIVGQRAFQSGIEVAVAKTVIIHFDYGTGTPAPIPEEIKGRLKPHLED